MEKPKIVLKIKVKQFSAILALAKSVYENMNGNPNFIAPNPSLSVLQTDIADLTDAIAKWGVVGNRGSHADHVDLENKAAQLHRLLWQFANYCMNTVSQTVPVEDQASVLISSGFPLKKPRTPQGALEMVQNFHRFIARKVRRGNVKLRWAKPLNVTTITNVKCYKVYRSATNDFAAAVCIKHVTAATYTDAPGAGAWYYWVVPFNYMGNGVTSKAVVAKVV